MLNPLSTFLGSLSGYLLIIFFALPLDGFAQGCDCPPINSCGACSGGLIGLTLKFNGGAPALVEAADGSGTLFSATVNPGEEFSFDGPLTNNKFQGPTITMKVSNVVNTTLSTGCSVFVGESYGSFKIVAGISLSGGALCCAPGFSESDPPVISNCPTDINVNLSAGTCTKAVSWTAPSATDNCELEGISGDHTPGEQFALGTTVVTYTALDIYGNSATCSFNVTVTDTQSPVISGCPSNISLTAGGACQATANWTAPLASDNCTLASFNSNFAPGSAFPLGTSTVTYTAIDGSGNSATCSFNVTVTDTQAPVISGCPTNMIVSLGATCDATVNWTAPVASDNCSLASFTSNFAPGSVFPTGTTQVTYTAIDGSGNTSTCSFTVTVSDTAPPVFSGCPSDIQVTVESSCSALVTWPAITATDNCSTPVVTGNHLSGELFPVGVTQIVCSATDAAGNTATCSFNVIVTNQVAPQLSNCPADQTITTNRSDGKAEVTWSEPNASVVCGEVTLNRSHVPGDEFPTGTTVVTYTASGPGGLSSTCSFNVTVNFVAGEVEVGQVITPDGDGFNDLWLIKNIDQYSNSVTIIDRWGSVIFEARDYNNETIVWDGTNLSGGRVPTGTYFYTLEIISGGQKDKRKGFIELIR